MADKNKKIGVEVLPINILNFQKKEKTILNFKTKEGEVDVLVFHSIPFAEANDFVQAVVSNCFAEGEYNPIYKDISIARAIIIYFTDCTVPENFDDVYKLINETDFVERVEGSISPLQLNVLKTSIDSLIEYKKAQSLKNSEFEALMIDLSNLASLGMEKLSKIDLTKIKFNKLNSLVDGIL